MIAEIAVDLAAIARNAAVLARIVAPARLAAVVKANAYGHGLVPVARAVAPHAARSCVYGVEEAVALRDAGIASPIHVLGPIPVSALADAHAADVQLTLWDRGGYLLDAARVARERGRPFAVQAKIDTGAARFGLPHADAPTVLATYAATSELALVGAFSHLAAVEEGEDAFTREQTARFRAATAGLGAGVERHLAATAAAVMHPQTRFDLVRCGIGLYGGRLPARCAAELEAALSWTTTVAALRDVAAGETVGYGRAWRAERASRIATLPIGYAEGLPRAAGGRARALVRGRAVPIVGRVCMNAAFLDVTDVPGAAAGDRVTLVGRDGEARIAAADLADACGTIDYEIFARLPADVPRRYGVTGT